MVGDEQRRDGSSGEHAEVGGPAWAADADSPEDLDGPGPVAEHSPEHHRPDHTQGLALDRTQAFPTAVGWPGTFAGPASSGTAPMGLPPSGPARTGAVHDPPGVSSGWSAPTPWTSSTPAAAPRHTAAAGSTSSAPSGPAPRQRRARSWPHLVGALLLGLVGGLTGALAAPLLQPDQQAAPQVHEAAPVVMEGGPTSVTAIARSVLPSVVFISVEGGGNSGVGSGFVVREDGYIVTNAHVVEAAADDGSVTVEFADDTTLEAEIVGQDISYDIAVIKVEASGLQPLRFGDSAALEVGAPVVAVGAPLGLDSTVTLGIISALERPVTTGAGDRTSFINAIQTDAAINPGNSGGPLVDLSGRVIGVNSALAQLPEASFMGPAGSIGLGFAIPSNQVERTANQLIETGTSNHPVIGVLVDTAYTGEGARVLGEDIEDATAVVPGGAADLAGVQPGDVILSIDGRRISDYRQMIVLLRSYEVGDTVEVVVRTGDQERTVSMVLQGSDP